MIVEMEVSRRAMTVCKVRVANNRQRGVVTRSEPVIVGELRNVADLFATRP